MAVRSADKKPEKYIGPDGKPRIRMVPVDKDVVKTEAANASKEAQRHMQGMKDARADMKVAKSADAMTKAMNKLQHHTKAHKKAMAAMEEAYKEPQGQAKRMMSPLQRARMDKEKADRDRYGKLKPGVIKKKMANEDNVDEISLKDLSNTIAKSTGNKNLRKALKTDKLKADLAKMKMATEAYETDPPSPDEKSMAMRQAKFIQYVGEELMEHMEQENDFPEWMQNKLSEFHQKAKDMHAVLAGEYEDDDEEDDVNESYRITKIYNPSTKASRAAKKSTATYAVHTHDRKYFKEFPSQKDAEAHLKSLSKKESVQIDEISQDMKQRYMNRASQAATAATVASKYTKGKEKEKLDRIAKNRKAGVKKVVGEKTQLDEYGGPLISRAKYLKQKPMKERELTPGELKKREKYAKDLPDAEFKKRYGDRWKSVKIATATKMAKGEK